MLLRRDAHRPTTATATSLLTRAKPLQWGRVVTLDPRVADRRFTASIIHCDIDTFSEGAERWLAQTPDRLSHGLFTCATTIFNHHNGSPSTRAVCAIAARGGHARYAQGVEQVGIEFIRTGTSVTNAFDATLASVDDAI